LARFGYTAAMPVPSIAGLRRRIEAIQRQIGTLGSLRPGTLSQQYNVCGTPGCRCKADPPERHGPYYQLSYTWHRKSHTQFVREDDLPHVRRDLANYERLRMLVDQWIDSAIEIARLERQERRNPQRKSTRKPRPAAKLRASGR
jgi:hypothetical protein